MKIQIPCIISTQPFLVVLLIGFATAFSIAAQAPILPVFPSTIEIAAHSDSRDDELPVVVADGNGNVVAVWPADSEVYVSTSSDNGLTWTPSTLLSMEIGSVHRGSLDVATNLAGRWIAVWSSEGDVDGAGADPDILFAISDDAGTTWTAPALLPVGGKIDSGEDLHPRIVADNMGNWVAVWSSDENLGGVAGTDVDIFASTSTDNGNTWSLERLVGTRATTDVGGDRRPAIATDRLGNWLVVWHSNENLGGIAGTDHDIFSSRSSDIGLTWSVERLVGTRATTDSGWDENPRVATDRADTWLVVWYSVENLGGIADTDSDIFSSVSTDIGATWSVERLVNTNATTDADNDETPDVAFGSGNNWIVVWHSRENLNGQIGIDRDILHAISPDGVTWSLPGFLHANAITDTGYDSWPVITTDGLGNWIVMWSSQEDLLTLAGTDSDIFVATFVHDPVSMPAFGYLTLAVAFMALALLAIRRALRI